MNRKAFQSNVFLVITFYVFALIFGIWLRLRDPMCNPANKCDPTIWYTTFKDFLNLIIAIPGAWLAYCFQRRQAYLKDVRELWSKLVVPVQDAIQYTHQMAPNDVQFGKIMRDLSIAIEEVRAVFANAGEQERLVGLFPFEGLKAIQLYISKLGFGANFNAAKAEATRIMIVNQWKEMRGHYLTELERKAPGRPHSPFLG